MTKDTINIDDLFEQARMSEPELADDNFTHSVMAKISQHVDNQEAASFTNPKLFNWYDLTGISIGLISCFTFFNPIQLINLTSQFIADQITLSPATILTSSIVMSVLAISAWVSVEGKL